VTMRFTVDQRVPHPPPAVIAAYTDPALYAAMVGLARVDRPEVLGVEQAGDTTLVRVRYRFVADLPGPARAVIDPDKLTWVDESRYDRAAGTSSTRLLPDHYADRLQATASSRFEPDPVTPGGTLRRVTGELSVKARLVGGRVEQAIVEGLQEHLVEEARVVAAHLGA
jgi:hypothetical protein